MALTDQTRPDPSAAEDEDPEEFAEQVGADPTAQEVDEYREMIRDPRPDYPDKPDPDKPDLDQRGLDDGSEQ